ncbi:MAG: SPOR domain-containing protein [Succinivibrio sp.]|nr:SPOR domain-containing protein [Succinivibrio sp.]
MATTSKILRNRIVGLLIILSVVLILVPAMMPPDEVSKKSSDSIAVNKDGVVDNQQGGTSNYNDLLAPEDDLQPSQNARQNPSEIARQNSSTPDYLASSEPLPVTDNPEISMQEEGNPFLESTAAQLPPPELSSANRRNTAGGDNSEAQRSQDEDRMGDFVRKLEHRPAAKDTRSTAKTQTEAKPKSSPKSVAPAPKSEPSSAKGFVVQVGVFSKLENAQNVVAKLKKGGVSARQESAQLNGKRVYRVYAGSAGSRQNAESVAAKVKAITGSEGRIVSLN